MTPWLSVVGIGEDGLDALAPAARALVDGAETLVGGARHLALVPARGEERLTWARPLSDTMSAIAARRGRRVCVLASGDPLWYGVGAMLVRHFAAEEMTIVPQPSAFSLAAARLGWPLADCTCLTLHGRPLSRLRLHLAPGARLLLLANDGDTPAAVARLLVETGWGASRMTVLEHMGGAGERRRDGRAEAWDGTPAADLNTIAVACVPVSGTRALPRCPGLPDDVFRHDGQLTKRWMRAVTLAALAPLPGALLWDIGAGSGAVAIEWLRSPGAPRAVAIEREPERARRIAVNAEALGVPELRVVTGAAPAALAGLDPPDAVFVGGGVAEPEILEIAWAALPPGGRLVANAVTLAAEARLLDWHARHGGELHRIAVAQAEPLGATQAWRPALPATQLVAVKT